MFLSLDRDYGAVSSYESEIERFLHYLSRRGTLRVAYARDKEKTGKTRLEG